MSVTLTGTIKHVDQAKMFGFIKAEDGTEYFFHRSAVAGDAFRELEKGDRVVFAEEYSPKGPRAASVSKVARLPAGR